MKFVLEATALFLLSSSASTNAFAPLAVSSGTTRTTTSSVLSATIEQASSVVAPKTLIPPVTDETDIEGLYSKYIQTTYGRYPITIVRGEGCKLFDDSGKEYLDFVSGIATCALGHAHPALTAAITKQMETMHHISNLYFIPAQAQLAQWLTDNSCAEKVFFCNSGAEANEAAIKCARKHAANRGITRPVIITAHQSFHGRTLAALSATAQPKYHKGFTYDGKMVPGFEYVTYNNVDELKEAVAKINANPELGLAAIMMEPLQGEGGIIPGTLDFFQTARDLCDETGALLICDEVQIGMGRSGQLWGHEYIGDTIQPDIFTSAKALGGGVPIGAMLARGAAATVFGPGDHASTYGGNPLACAAGIAVAKTMCDENLLQNVQDRGAQLSAGLEALAVKYPTVLGAVRGWGLLKGVVVNSEFGTAGELVGEAMKQGLLLVPAGPTVARFVPALIVSSEEIEAALAKFEAAIETMIESKNE